MRIIEDTKLDFSDVLIVPKRSTLTSRKEVRLERRYEFKNSGNVYYGTPIISSNMDQTGTVEMAKALDKFGVSTAIHKHYEPSDLIDFFSLSYKVPMFYSMGISLEDYEKFKHVHNRINGKIDYVCIDVANGYSEPFEKFISTVRNDYPEITIMAGSVVTPEMTEQLLVSGADIVRIGIGSGSVCTTRKMTGVGYPQLSAIIECADAAHGMEGHICSDGGCQMPGDIAKAIAGGADFVMLGGLLSGHDECGGELVTVGDRHIRTTGTGYIDVPTHMKFYGMSSKAAMDKYSNGVAEYRSAEGKEVLVPYRGKVENTIKEILGGIRSTCTYVGASKLKELSKRTNFIKVNRTHNTIFGDEK